MGIVIIRPAGLVKVTLPITVVRPEDADQQIKAAIRDRQRGYKKERGLGVF